jgi:hypothetical protein
LGRYVERNVGTADRIARIALGVGTISLAFVGPQSNWGFLGLIFLATAAMGTCPIYSILGMSTCKVAKS